MAWSLGNIPKWFSFVKQYGLGQAADVLGTYYHAPEVHASEKLAGGPTVNTYNYQYAQGLNPYSTSARSFIPTSTVSPSGQTRTWNIDSSSSPSSQSTSRSTSRFGGGGRVVTPDYALKMGWDINNLPSGYSLAGPSAQEIAEQEARIRGNIENTYNDYIKSLDEQAGLYPQWQQEDISNIEKQISTAKEGIRSQKESALNKLEIARQDVEAEKRRAQGNVEQQLRNLLLASQTRLGLSGAGASSASETMLPFALSKQAGRAGADIARGALQNIRQIDMKKQDVASTYDMAVKDLEQQKINKLAEIEQFYRDAKMAIEQAKRGANEKKMIALTNLDESLMQSLIARVNQLEAETRQRRYQLEDWVRDRMAQLDNYKMQLNQTANFTPQKLVWNELRGIGETGTSNGSDVASYINWINARRKQLGLE